MFFLEGEIFRLHHRVVAQYRQSTIESFNLLLGSKIIAVAQSSGELICEKTHPVQCGNISRNPSQVTTLRVAENKNINSHSHPDLRNVVNQLFSQFHKISPYFVILVALNNFTNKPSQITTFEKLDL